MEDRDKSIDKSIDERVHQQLVYKDNRIIDLNNVILDKERQILDLQVSYLPKSQQNTSENFHFFRKESASTMRWRR